MKRILPIFLLILFIIVSAVPAFAATKASSVRVDAILSDDGTCQVTVTADLSMDKITGDIHFPIPGNAYGISLNGGMALTRRSGDLTYVDLTRLLGGVVGDFTLVLRYTLPGTVTYNDLDRPQLDLPLLSGFVFPISKLDFTLTLPEQVQAKPVFSSGYHNQTIEEDLTYAIAGNQITGTVSKELKDHETLTMSLEVTEETFPRNLVEPWSAGFEDMAILVISGLAVLYWFIFLRCAPHLRQHTAQPPEGCTAGELSCVLLGRGADLTMMVFTWAKLGYILIHVSDGNRVKLHKRMEMGNERGRFEVKVFNRLFGNRRTVDGSSHHYAELARKVAASKGGVKDVFRRNNGNVQILRILSTAAGVCGGASLGITMAGNALLSVLVILLMAILGAAASWFIQGWVKGLHLRDRFSLLLGLGLSALWICVGCICGEGGVATGVVLGQLLTGLAGFYGGRRTEFGRRMTSEIFGLRHYLRTVSSQELNRQRLHDPDYFFTMAPYAMAFGVEKSFAKHFGNRPQNACPYLTTGMDGHINASDWAAIMVRAAKILDERQKKLPFERFLTR